MVTQSAIRRSPKVTIGLAVDDLRLYRCLMTISLRAAGYIPISVVDGFDAWLIAEIVEPNVIITDLDMVTWGGVQLIEAIRLSRNIRVCHVPIIVCSATQDALSIQEAFDAGATYFLSKPIDISKLCRLITF
ncbi:MAG: response regulator [Pirellulaceae bacterium]|nr:response regulator [Pirellulaceae bacterium]